MAENHGTLAPMKKGAALVLGARGRGRTCAIYQAKSMRLCPARSENRANGINGLPSGCPTPQGILSHLAFHANQLVSGPAQTGHIENKGGMSELRQDTGIAALPVLRENTGAAR